LAGQLCRDARPFRRQDGAVRLGDGSPVGTRPASQMQARRPSPEG
jgi:hypothetical protein